MLTLDVPEESRVEVLYLSHLILGVGMSKKGGNETIFMGVSYLLAFFTPPTPHLPPTPSKNMGDQGLKLGHSFSLFFSKPQKVCFVRNSFQFSHLLLREASDHPGHVSKPEMFKGMKP